MPNHGARFHARFPASGAHRWTRCTASIKYTENLPDITTVYAEEGTEAHECLERVLTSEIKVDDIPGVEMREGAATVLDEIEGRTRQGWVLFSEQYGEFAPGAGGTVDICLLRSDHREMAIIDYKFGKRPVDATDNRQLLSYAAVLTRHFTAVEHIDLIIAQPRAFHPDGPVRTWRITRAEVEKFVEIAGEAMKEAEGPSPKFEAGEWCRYCKAEAICPEFERKALAVANESFSDVRLVNIDAVPAPQEIPLDRLAHVLNAKAVLEEWLKAVDRAAIGKLYQGFRVPGWKLVEAKPRRKFKGEPQAIAHALADRAGVAPDEFLELRVVGVTDAERKLKAGVRATMQALGYAGKDVNAAVKDAAALMADLTERESSGTLTLVPDTDPRQLVSPVGNAFDGVTIEHQPEPPTAAATPMWPGAQMLHGDDGVNLEDLLE